MKALTLDLENVPGFKIAMNDSAASSSILWRYIVVDEGHRLKNRNSKQNRNRKQNRKTRFSRPFIKSSLLSFSEE